MLAAMIIVILFFQSLFGNARIGFVDVDDIKGSGHSLQKIPEANLIFQKAVNRSVPKFTSRERTLIQSIVATLSIKRIPDFEIVNEFYERTKKTITEKTIYNITQRIKKESYHWYKTMREGQYEYIHEFKERINEIMDLQKRHYAILESLGIRAPRLNNANDVNEIGKLVENIKQAYLQKYKSTAVFTD